MVDDIHLIISLTLCAFEFIFEENFYKLLSNTNGQVSIEKEIKLLETIWTLLFIFKIFDLTRRKIRSYGQLTLVGEFSTQLKVSTDENNNRECSITVLNYQKSKNLQHWQVFLSPACFFVQFAWWYLPNYIIIFVCIWIYVGTKYI